MTEPVIDYARTKAIAAAIQTKTRATCRVHPGEDRISIKGRDGTWRDYTADEAARGYGLSAFLKDAKPHVDAESLAAVQEGDEEDEEVDDDAEVKAEDADADDRPVKNRKKQRRA